MAKVKSPGIAALRVATQAGVVSGGFKPVGVDGKTPALWANCVGYEVENSTDVDTQDLLVAIQEGEKAKKLKAADKVTRATLEVALVAEKKKAKDDREKGPKVTPDKVKVDDPLTRGR